MNRLETAEPARDPVLLVHANGRVLSANTAFHKWLSSVAPHCVAGEFSARFAEPHAARWMWRRASRSRRTRHTRFGLRSLFTGAQFACEGVIDGAPSDETVLVRLHSACESGDDVNAPGLQSRLNGARLPAAGPERFAGQSALCAIAAAAHSLSDSQLDPSQRALVGEIERTVSTMLHGIRRPGLAGRALEQGRIAMHEDRGLRVLLVEDNPVNRTVASRMLIRLGLPPEVCTNGHEAVERATAQPYDLILMDVQMPEMDGIEATYRIRQLRRETRPIRIVALTANTIDETRQACERAGMDAFLAKPFTLAELSATLNRLLDPCD